MTTSTKPAICRGQTQSGLPRSAQNTERRESSAGRSARAHGGGEQDDRSEVRPQRRVAWGQPACPEHSSLGLYLFPATPAPLYPNSQRGQFPCPLSRAHWKEKGKGLPCQVPALREPLPTPPGPEICHASWSLRTPRFAQAEEEQPCFLSRRRQARGWGGFSCRGRARVDWGRAQLRSCTNTAVGWRCTRSCGQGCGSPRDGMRGEGGQRMSTPTHTHAHTQLPRPQKLTRRAPGSPAPRLRAAPAELQPARPATTACTKLGVPWPPHQGGLRLASCRPRTGSPTYPLLPELRHRLSLFRHGPPPSVAS